MGIWAEIKHALNRTIGTSKFKPLNDIVADEAYNAYRNTVIAFDVFSGGNGMDIATFPFNITEIEDSAYRGSNVTKAFIPKNVLKIGNYAFAYSKLSNFFIDEGLEEIGKSAFENCQFLTHIYLPRSLRVIGDTAFAECRGLYSIDFNGTIAEWRNIQKGNNWAVLTEVTDIQCTDGRISVDTMEMNYED